MMRYSLIVRIPGEDIKILTSDNLVMLLEKRDELNGNRPGLPCRPLHDHCEALVEAHPPIPMNVTMDWNNVEENERPEYVVETF